LQLLGSQSNDIDVAVEDMMGLAFATHLVTFARARGIEATEPAVVKSNPDQSKHLETTKVRVYDMELDLVNLRSEEYAEGSRIPTEVVSLVCVAYESGLISLTATRNMARPWKTHCGVISRSMLCFTTSIHTLSRITQGEYVSNAHLGHSSKYRKLNFVPGPR
jgi:hypothetical protein